MGSDQPPSKGSSSSSGLMFITTIGFMSMSFVLLYQRRLIADTHVVANELKMVHNAERFLSRALKEKDFAEVKLDEGAAALALEEKLLKQAEELLKIRDRKGFALLLQQEESEEKAARQALESAKARESKARSAERAAEQLSAKLESELSDEALIYDHKEDKDALVVLNASLVEFETMDKALEARQQAIHANLERIRRTNWTQLEASDSQTSLEQERGMAQQAKEKESKATEAMARAAKSLKLAEQFLEKHNARGAEKNLKDEERQEASMGEALRQAKSLLDNAKLAAKAASVAGENPKLDQNNAEVVRLEREAKKLQEERDAMHQKHDKLKQSIKFEEKRRKIVDEEKRLASKEKELQKHALVLKGRVVQLMQKETELFIEFQRTVEEGNMEQSKDKVQRIEQLNAGLTKQFAKLKKEMGEAHRQANKAAALSKRLLGSEMVAVGGQDARIEKSLANLSAELQKLDTWEAMAKSKHDDVLKQVDSMKESQGF